MSDLISVCVTAPIETVIKKLSKNKIAIFNVKKQKNTVIFQVREEYIKKVFAIFSHPCYNMVIRDISEKSKYLSFTAKRFGVFVGCVLFVALSVFSQSFILKIKVTGSGSYLKDDIISLMRENGVEEGKYFFGLNKPVAESSILALPNVTFCSVKKSGAILVVDVQAEGGEGGFEQINRAPLHAEVSGRVANIVALCGTIAVNVGDEVQVGDALICPYEVGADGNLYDCVVVGYAEITCSKTLSVNAQSESEESLKDAYSATLVYTENPEIISHTVKRIDNGVVYEITFSYSHVCSINL